MTDQSPSLSSVVWNDAPASGAPPAAAASAAPGAALLATSEPNRGNVVWDPPSKGDWDDAPAPEQSKYHTLQAVARGFLSTLDMLTGETHVPGYSTEGRNKAWGIDDPHAGLEDKFAEMAGGLIFPVPGLGPAKALTEVRAADQALGTLGQQTGSGAAKAIERTLARLPGGGGLVKALEGQTERLAHTSEEIVKHLSGGADASATAAGQTIKGQLGEAAKRMKAESAAHYDEVEKLIPPGTHVGVSSTLGTLRELTAPMAGAEATSAALANSKIATIREALESDVKAAGSESLPYSVLKKLRTKIGDQIEWGPFSTDAANGQLKKIYSSLTADMNNGAASVSSEASEAVGKANAAYAVSKEQQKILSSVLNKAGGPEKVFTSLMSGTKEGATTLKQVLGAIDQPSRNVLAASALQRMGRATAVAQDAAGAAFSPATFLTNWNKMAPEARQAMFGSLPGEYSTNVTKLAENVSRLKDYSKVLPNSSNTAQATLWGAELASGITAVLTGNPLLAAKIAVLPAGTKMLSYAMTNPQTVKWLAAETSRLIPPAVQATAAVSEDTPRTSPMSDLRKYGQGASDLQQLAR